MRSKRSAFTLVELLVVISIIGMLMAILLPAIGAATESARAAQCKNRTKQLALAMLGYESRTNAFPGYADGREVDGTPVPFSWVVAILPDVERQDVYDQWPAIVARSNDDLEPPYLDFLVCPSDPPLNKSTPWTSYVANAGHDKNDASGCGILHTAWPLSYLDRRNRKKNVVHQKTTIDKISAADGTSTTILLSENIQAGTWADISFFDEDADPTVIPAEKEGTPHNVFVFTNRENPTATYLINSEQSPANSSRPNLRYARPSSEHRSGVNVAFADGHVEFLRENIEYTVYARLTSSDGKKCAQSLGSDRIGHTVILSDTDYK